MPLYGYHSGQGPMTDTTCAVGTNSAHRAKVVGEIASRLGVPISEVTWLPLPDGMQQAVWCPPESEE